MRETVTLLAVDIGGTNIRCGLAAPDGKCDAPITDIAEMRCADFSSPADAITAYLARARPAKPLTACGIAVAGPVMAGDDRVDITNSHWHFGKRELLAALPVPRLLIINDFIAQALAQTRADIRAANTAIIKTAGKTDEKAPLLVIGAGTGLGIGALINVGNADNADDTKYIALAGEGGHATFAPRNERERDFESFRRVETGKAHITWEHAASGPGLEAIYRFLAARHNAAEPSTPESLPADAIGAAAMAGEGPAREAVLMFCEILATATADSVLAFGCWRGAVLCGGIMPRFAALLPASDFAARFTAADSVSPLMARIPVWLATHPHPGLAGVAAALACPAMRRGFITAD